MTDPMKKAVPLAGAGAMSFNGTALAEIDSSRARLPSTYNAAKKAISQCASIDECKDWSDKAAALASYAKQANDETLLNLAQRIRARAVRQAGKLLLDVEEQRGGDRRSDQRRGAPTLITRTQVAVEAGLSRDQAVTAVRVARVPDAAFEEQVEDARPATVSALADQGKKARPAPKTRTPSGSRSARARDQVLANLMRLWNRAEKAPSKSPLVSRSRTVGTPAAKPSAKARMPIRALWPKRKEVKAPRVSAASSAPPYRLARSWTGILLSTRLP